MKERVVLVERVKNVCKRMTSKSTTPSATAHKTLTDAAVALLGSAEIRNGGGASVTIHKVCFSVYFDTLQRVCFIHFSFIFLFLEKTTTDGFVFA